MKVEIPSVFHFIMSRLGFAGFTVPALPSAREGSTSPPSSFHLLSGVASSLVLTLPLSVRGRVLMQN